MWRRNEAPSLATQQAEQEIASALTGSGDSLPAWNAVWDLVQSRDSQGKQEVLDALKAYIETSVAGAPEQQARQFEEAIEQSLTSLPLRRRILPSKELREQHQQDQVEAHREAMRDLGVRPGDGLPMWSMYMTRRSKRTWSS